MNSPENQPIQRIGLSLFVILTGSFLAPLLMHSSTLAIPAIAAELRLDAEALSWFTLINVLGNACLILPAGKLADIYGRRRLFSFGVLISGCSCILGGLAINAELLLAGRLLQGIGGAFIFGCAIALVSGIPPEEKKAQVMGIYIAICYMGIVAGPVFGGFILKYLDWRWVFHIPGIILLATALIGFTALPWERYGDRNTRLRVLDTTLYMASLVLIAMAVFKTAELSGQLLMAAGVLMFAGFCWFQSKRRDPLLQVTLFRDNSIYATLGITHLLSYSGLLALPFAATLYLQYLKAIDPQTTGLILLVQALFTALIAPAGGWLLARMRVQTILIFGMFILLVGMVIFASLNTQSDIWAVGLALCLIGAAVGLVDTQLLRVSLASVEERLLGSASATLNGLRTVGGFIGIGIISYLMGSTIGKQEITPAIYPKLMIVLHDFFVISSILTFCALALLTGAIYLRSRESTEDAE